MSYRSGGRWIAVILAVTVPFAPVAAENARDRLIAYLTDTARHQTAARALTVAAIATPEQGRTRQARVRALVTELTGYHPTSGPVRAKVTGGATGNGYVWKTLWYESRPGYRVSAILYLPAAGNGPFPAIIVQPGHGIDGKIGDHGFAANLARAGFIVLSIDIVGEGERLQHYDPEIGASKVGRPTGEHSMLAGQAMPIGGAVARYFIADAARGVDYLAGRADVDPQRIGAFGCSGGGTVTAYLAALDPRIRATAVGCYVNDFSHLLAPGGPGPQDGEQSIPFFLERGLDIADWVEAAAPRPFAIVATREDMFPIDGARTAFAEVRRFYGVLGAGNRIMMIEGPGRHGALAPIMPQIVGFFTRWLRDDWTERPFVAVPIGDPARLLVVPDGVGVGGATLQQIIAGDAPPRRTVDRSGLREAIREIARTSVSPGDAAPVVTLSSTTSPGAYAVSTLSFDAAPQLSGEGRYAQAAGAGRHPTLLLLSAQPDVALDAYARAGWNVLALEPRGTGGNEELKSPLTGDWTLLSLRALLVGRTPVGMRVDDAIAMLNWLKARPEVGPVAVYGDRALGPVALHVGVLDDRVAAVVSAGAITRYRDFVERPISRDMAEVNLPGVLTRYDLPDLMASIGDRLTLLNPVDTVGQPLDARGRSMLMPARPRIIVRAERDPVEPIAPPLR
jgi:cephalosporin-C deacetylase-like acetyl esterase